MRRRPSSRLIILDPRHRVLLFHMIHRTGVLAGKEYWATPGGGLEPGETFEAAALRELQEETGLQPDDLGRPAVIQEVVFQLPSGEQVIAEERYYAIRAKNGRIGRNGWTQDEREVITEHRWWSLSELMTAGIRFFPENLIEIVQKILSSD